MQTEPMPLDGVLMFLPTPHHDDRGFFTRTFDATTAWTNGIDAGAFVQDSQSRSRIGTVRGLHGRLGEGESKLVRCSHGAIFDVIVDARPTSPTFGQHLSVILDDTTFAHLYVPAGMLHGFQALTEMADICYRIDREHAPAEDIAVRYDDPFLGIDWPLPVAAISKKDRTSGSWSEFVQRIRSGHEARELDSMRNARMPTF